MSDYVFKGLPLFLKILIFHMFLVKNKHTKEPTLVPMLVS